MIEPVLQMTAEDIGKKVQEGIDRQGAFSPAIIKQDIDRDAALVLMELEPHATGLRVIVEPTRTYTTGALLSHVLGYVGRFRRGIRSFQDAGYLYQDYIGKKRRGQSEKSRGKIAAVRRVTRPNSAQSERRAIDGANASLTPGFAGGRRHPAVERRGSITRAAVMDVHTGEVLAMVSLPSYDNNIFSGTIDDAKLAELINSPGKPLVNHDLSEQYPPGSTFKTIVGSAALQEGVASPGTTITSRGYITVENEFDPNVLYRYPDAILGLDYSLIRPPMSISITWPVQPTRASAALVERVAAYARAFGLASRPSDIPDERPRRDGKEDTVGEP
jgi:penicillin-binding protein 2